MDIECRTDEYSITQVLRGFADTAMLAVSQVMKDKRVTAALEAIKPEALGP